MAEFVLMPKLGLVIQQGTIARWFKSEGDAVVKGEPIADVENDKASSDVESPSDGVVLKVFYSAESNVLCGKPIAVIGKPGEEIPAWEEATASTEVISSHSPAPDAAVNEDSIFRMPKLGMDMEEGVVGRWLKAEGDTVNKGEILAEIETDKASVEVESPVSGTVLKIYIPEGEAKACGTPIAFIGNPGDPIPDFAGESVVPADDTASDESPAHVDSDLFFRMPKLGMDMVEGVIVKWLKSEGDTVQKGEPFVEIETDKAAVVSEATVSGVILKLYYPEEACVACGEPIAAIGAVGQKAPELKPHAENAPVPESASPAPASVLQTSFSAARTDVRVIASPRARRCASQNHIELSQIIGTGEKGRIVEQDVLDYLTSKVTKTCSFRVPKDEITPLSGMRRIIANRMKESLQEMAQTNTRMDVDMSNMVAFRKQINEKLVKKGIKVSYVDLLVAVCAKALIENPQANVSLEADGIHTKNYANIGIAVDSEKGLVVPVVKDADILSIPEISRKSRDLIDKARKGALRPDDMKGGTFTISNLGMFEVDSFTAIVNPPETCILAVGRIVDKPVVVDGQIVIRPMMNLCLSYDHRVIDGAPSAHFLQCVKHYIENPVWLLL